MKNLSDKQLLDWWEKHPADVFFDASDSAKISGERFCVAAPHYAGWHKTARAALRAGAENKCKEESC